MSDIPPILRDAARPSLLNAKCGKQSWLKNVFDWAVIRQVFLKSVGVIMSSGIC